MREDLDGPELDLPADDYLTIPQFLDRYGIRREVLERLWQHSAIGDPDGGPLALVEEGPDGARVLVCASEAPRWYARRYGWLGAGGYGEGA